MNKWARCKHGVHLKHRKHSFTDVVSGLYLRSEQTGWFGFSEVEEVDVLGSSWEVVVHDDGSGTYRSGSSCSCFVDVRVDSSGSRCQRGT